MHMFKYLITLLACLVGITANGQAAVPSALPPAAPVEMIVMDPAGRTLFGHGVADGSEILLRLQYDIGTFVVLLVDSSGAIESIEGREGRSGQLWLRQADGDEILLVELFRNLGIRLTVERVGDAQQQPDLGDDPGPAPARPPASDDDPGDDIGDDDPRGDDPADDDPRDADDPDDDEDDDDPDDDEVDDDEPDDDEPDDDD